MTDGHEPDAVEIVVEPSPARPRAAQPAGSGRAWAFAVGVFGAWVLAVAAVAVARVDPWEQGASWSKWLKADQRGWELIMPGALAATAVGLVLWAQRRWGDERWSPVVAGLTVLGAAAGAGAILWGLYCLDLGPWGI